MGFWSDLFPGEEGRLADLFWGSSASSGGILLKDSTYNGTQGDDTVVFGSQFWYYTPYNVFIYLLDGSDAVEFTDTASLTTVDLGDGSLNVLKTSESFRYSKLYGGSGGDLFLFKPVGGWGVDNLFKSTLDAKGGSDTVIFSKDRSRAFADSILIDSSVSLGEGNDSISIDAFGRISANSFIELGAGDDGIVFIDRSANTSGIVLDSVNLDCGEGNDSVDLSRVKIASANNLILNGGSGYDTLRAPAGFDYAPYKESFEYIYLSGLLVYASNASPSALNLSVSSFSEAVAAGATVAALSSLDPDASNTFSYSLIPGDGSTDNAAFTIAGEQLIITASPNFEAKSSYAIRLRTTDQGGLSFERQVTLSVSDVNEAPTALNLSASSFSESVAAGATVATLSSLDPDASNTFSYSLVAGEGSTDNAAFTIAGDQLKITASPNFQAKSSYAIRLRTTDQSGFSFELQISLAVKATSTTVPTYTLTLSSTSINEGSSLSTIVATRNVAVGTTLYWSVSGTGINAADFSSGPLSGSGIVGADGKFSFARTLTNDLTTEGDETLLVKLFSDSALTLQLGTTSTVTIKDVSITPHPIIKDLSGKEASGVTAAQKTSSLSALTASVPLKAESRKLLDRYKINDSTSAAPKKASDIDSSFIDFTIKTGALNSITAEIALDKEVKANAYVKVNPNTGEAFDFTYDPITGLGAELLDTNKNGLVDILKIHLQDGAKGDVDGLINGEIRDPGVLADAPRQSVYRFFKASKGVHLYSSSEEERAIVNANPEWGYKDEGVAYDALVTQGKALHRFFNAKASYHFMTTNDEEAKTVKANPAWGFSYEGESFSVSTISQLGMSTPVNRFYRVLDGVGQHFYTASADEASNIIAHPEWGYKSEGVGWYV